MTFLWVPVEGLYTILYMYVEGNQIYTPVLVVMMERKKKK